MQASSCSSCIARLNLTPLMRSRMTPTRIPMNQSDDFVRLHGPVELASSETECWKCHKVTPVLALLAADVEEFVAGEEPERNEAPSFVYDLDEDALPPEVQASLGAAAPNYKPVYSRTLDETTWASICVHCGSLQGAFFMHSEPDGPFFGGPEEFKGQRALLSADGFDVDGASYSR